MSAVCSRCGETWPRDPALEIPCPRCNATAGSYCSHRRPSGHSVRFGAPLVHPERDQAALDAGILKPCAGAQK